LANLGQNGGTCRCDARVAQRGTVFGHGAIVAVGSDMLRSSRPRVRAATTEVALEVAGDGVTGGLRQLGRRELALEFRDVLGYLRVRLRQLVGPALPCGRKLLEVAQRQCDAN